MTREATERISKNVVDEWMFFRKISPYFSLWIILRLSTSVFAAFFSSIRPITSLEKEFAAWPPRGDIGLWFTRAFLSPWMRWDAIWYQNILLEGYSAGNGSTSFHPLYIMFTKPLYWLGIEPSFSLLITSSLASLGFFWIFYKLARLDLEPKKSWLALILLATFPLSIILFAPYTESLFLLFSTLALYQMRQRRWLETSILICLSSLTRQQGVFLIFPMALYAWEDSGKTIRGLGQAWKCWLVVVTAPAGLFMWTIYRVYFLHEGSLDTQNLQSFIYSALLSPSAKIIFPDQSLILPWNAVAIALPKLLHNPEISDVMSVGLGVWFLVILVLAWKFMKPADRLYSLVISLISFSMCTGAERIYLSLPRHLFIAIPVYIGLASVLEKSWQRIIVISLQLFTLFFMLFIYVTKSWIP